MMLLMSCYHVCNVCFTISCQCAVLAHLHQTWVLGYFALLMTMNYFFKDIYVILIHILGKERCIYCLWSFVNMFTFVSKHIEIFQDQIQMQCLLHMLL
jgi:hypothetical protein